MTPADVRDRLIAALRTDLVGPALPDELLNEIPTRWYLTGFLAPLNASVDQRSDPEAAEQTDLLESAGVEDNVSPEPTAARHSLFPASLGLSVLVSADTPHLTVQLDWGDYQRLDPPAASLAAVPALTDAETPAPAPGPEQWQRLPRHSHPITLKLPASGHQPRDSQPVAADPRLKLTYSVRALPSGIDERLPPGARIVSIFLSNERGDAPKAECHLQKWVRLRRSPINGLGTFLQKSLRFLTGVGATGLKFTGVGATGFDFKQFYYGGPFDPQELPERHRPVCQRQESEPDRVRVDAGKGFFPALGV